MSTFLALLHLVALAALFMIFRLAHVWRWPLAYAIRHFPELVLVAVPLGIAIVLVKLLGNIASERP